MGYLSKLLKTCVDSDYHTAIMDLKCFHHLKDSECWNLELSGFLLPAEFWHVQLASLLHYCDFLLCTSCIDHLRQSHVESWCLKMWKEYCQHCGNVIYQS